MRTLPWFSMMAVAVLAAFPSRAAPRDEPRCPTTKEPLNLQTWVEESYSSVAGFPAGKWFVSTSGGGVSQDQNGQPTLLVSDFQMGHFVTAGRVRVVPGRTPDDDFIGFALGFLLGDSVNAAADYLLVDWKKDTQYADFGWPSRTPGSMAKIGLAISRVRGVPTADEFWGHVDFDHPSSPPGQGVEELARARTLGSTGWKHSRDYEFRFEFSKVGLRVLVDDMLQLEVPGDFSELANQRFAFYNFSQQRVRYSGFKNGRLCPTAVYEQPAPAQETAPESSSVTYEQAAPDKEDVPVGITSTEGNSGGDTTSHSTATPSTPGGSLSSSSMDATHLLAPESLGIESFASKIRYCTAGSDDFSGNSMRGVKKAMSWALLDSIVYNRYHAYALVGADATTNPYRGDTSTSQALPILCINTSETAHPGNHVIGSSVQTSGSAWRGTWSNGTIALTPPIVGTSLMSQKVADCLCANQFSAGYRMAEFHDGDSNRWSGWGFWAEVRGANLAPFQHTRFWVSIYDKNTNPW